MKETIEKYGKNKFTLTIIGIVILVTLIFAYQAGKQGWVGATDSIASTTTSSTSPLITGTSQAKAAAASKASPVPVATAVSGMCGLRITSPVIYAHVGFPLTISGIMSFAQAQKDGCSWNTELSNAGSAELFYNLRNQGWTSSGTTVPVTMANTGASTSTLSFTTTMNLYTTALGLTSGSPLKVVFTDNPVHETTPHSFTFYLFVK